jgi:polyisoprenoid-binding protein YceI
MTVHAGRYRLGPDRGRITLRTYREGLASTAGHDLTIAVGSWSGDLTAGDDGIPTALDVTIDMRSLTVVSGSGGVKPLTDRDRREIAATARKVLAAAEHPEATFSATSFEPGGGPGSGGAILGTLTLRGTAKPVRVQVSETATGRYRAATSIVQTDHGIKPYTGFFGALKVRNSVDVEVDVDLSAPDGGPAA